MARNKFSDDIKLQIINDYKAGIKQKLICEKYSVPKSSVSKIIKRYYKNHTVTTNHSGGRPRKTSKKQDKLIANELKECPSLKPREVINKLNLGISRRTIMRRANEAGLGSYRSVEKPLVTETNRFARLKFAKEHINWSRPQWDAVIFTDESIYQLRSNNDGEYIKVWVCFSSTVLGPIHRMEESQNKKEISDEAIYKNGNISFTQQTPKDVQDWLQSVGASILKWPSKSLDLNPIEELWELIDKKIRHEKYLNGDDLFYAISREWEKISMETINSLINSMHRRCKAVVESNGYPTKYWPRSTYTIGDTVVKQESKDIHTISKTTNAVTTGKL